MAGNTFGRQVVQVLTNKSGGAIVAGDVVVIDTANNDAFTTSTAGAVTGIVGVAQESIANNAAGRILTEGYAALVNVSASVTRGHYGKTHTVAKQAVGGFSARAAGTFCQFLTGGTTPDGLLFPTDLGAGSGSVGSCVTTGATVATAQGTTSGSFVDLATVGPSVTVTTGTSVLCTVSADVDQATPGNAAYIALVISGATTVAVAQKIVARPASATDTRSKTFLITGLNAGSNTFKMQYAAGGGTTASFSNREIIIAPTF